MGDGAGRVEALLAAHSLHEMDVARLLLDCGCPLPFTGMLTTAQAEALGTWLDVDPLYLLRREEHPVRMPHPYHNAPMLLWSALADGIASGRLREVLLLKVRGVDLDRLPRSWSTDNPRVMVAVVLKLRRFLGSYEVASYQLWEPLPWNYDKSRAELLSVLLLVHALDVRKRGGVFFRGIQIDLADMDALVAGHAHISTVIGEGCWTPGWDLYDHLPPDALKVPARARALEHTQRHYGEWRQVLDR